MRRGEHGPRQRHGQGTSKGPYWSEYNIWRQMRQRCLNPARKEFHLWGGRGITICERWLNSFLNFLADMGPRPSPRHSLDRWSDPNGNYEPGNCRWATAEEQSSNSRRVRLVTFGGETKCLQHWAKHFGLNPSTLNHRLKIGWSFEQAISTPPNKHNRLTVDPNPAITATTIRIR